MKLKGKTVWITGASSGIGEALSEELSRRGANLVLSARRKDELDRVARKCTGGKNWILPLDLADGGSLVSKTSEAIVLTGGIDAIVHNGGISQRSLVKDTAIEIDRRLMEVNYFGAVGLTKALLPHFQERRSGQLVVVSSLAGYVPTPLRSSYAASKHALHGFFEALRAESAGQGIQITMVCPGFIRTNISLNALTSDGRPQGTMDNAQDRGMSPAECARRIADGVEANKDELFIAGSEVAALYLRRFIPSAYRAVMRRVKVV